jgi:ABC-2 type transport system ATP-binding protein
MSAISLSNLTKKFGETEAVSNLNLEVAENKIFGFLGPNGAGKTTAIRMMVGLLRPNSGRIEILGKKIHFGSTYGHNSFGFLPELPSIYPYLTACEFLSFVAEIFGITGLAKDTKVKKILALVDLESAKNKKVGAYSAGMKQRLGIGQALLNDPKVLIMDEPVSALDPIGRKEVLGVIQSLKRDKTIFMSTHILADVDRICDDIAIINKGKLLVQSPLSELKSKYATPILEVDFSHDASQIAKEIIKNKWLKKLESRGSSLKIWLKSEKVMEDNTPLKALSNYKNGILSYGLRYPDTEDLFIDIIGKEQ